MSLSTRLERRARAGQAAVLLALSLFAMLLLLAMATNIGVLVTDRIRMQTAADLGTYAVAYSQAASLNDLAQKNERIADVVKDCRNQLERGPIGGAWPGLPCDCRPVDYTAKAIIQSCELRIDQAIVDFANASRWEGTTSRALDAGYATADANFRGVDATFFEDRTGSPTRRGTFQTQWQTNRMGSGGTWDSIAPFRQVTDVKLNYAVIVECTPNCAPLPIPVPSWPVNVKAWFYKETDAPDIWAAGRVAGTPRRPFLDTAYSSWRPDGGYFGASSTGGDDKLVAYAVAKPFDGTVGPARASFLQRNGNVIRVTPPFGVFASSAIWFPKFTMQDTYKARLAGINDKLAGRTTPAQLVSGDASRVGRWRWDTRKFHH